MADITAGAVKSLREKTGAGMVDCKNALVEANGDETAAVESSALPPAANAQASEVLKRLMQARQQELKLKP